MNRSATMSLYQHQGRGLLRAAAVTHTDLPADWPDPTDGDSCRAWLHDVWRRPGLVEAIRLATPGLAARVDQIATGRPASDRHVCRAALSVVRYLLRAVGRHTPFGLFAGAAPVSIESAAKVRWGGVHTAVVQPDTQWLAAIIEQLEASPELLERLQVVANDLVVRRGGRLEVPNGPGRASIRCTRPAQLALEEANAGVGFADLADRLAERFAAVDAAKFRALLIELVRQGFLITSLRSPLTVTDPLGYLCDRLEAVRADELPALSAIGTGLREVHSDVGRHNDLTVTEPSDGPQQARDLRTRLVDRMRRLSDAGRVPLATTLRLDCEVHLPDSVARELERAATVLMRLTRQPTGEAAWRDYYTAFCDRYGLDALVPLADVMDPDTGLGLPATYPGSTFTEPTGASVSPRDQKLLALAWQALADRADEIMLTDEVIAALEVDDLDDHAIPPHVEIAARIDASDCTALQRGDFQLTVRPARAVGTLTSRFADLAPEAMLADIYGRVPVGTEDAVPVQMSFPPLYPHAENICRVPAYLPGALSIGEYRRDDDHTVRLNDLAVMATRDGLHLVNVTTRQVVEPQAFHALALDKQPPPMARFLAHLSRGNGASWHAFDWGPAARHLSYLPQVRYGRSVLSKAQWRLSKPDLPQTTDLSEWTAALKRWRDRWRCPAHVELVDADRALPLDLTVPAHVAIARAHFAQHDKLTFVAAVDPARLGWIEGHVHNVVLPMFTTRPPSPSPLRTPRPLLTNAGHGQSPGASGADWLYVKLFTHPERMNHLLAIHLPRLIESMADELGQQPDCWFARYRSHREPDHLRLRLRTHSEQEYCAGVAAVGQWTHRLRDEGLAGRLVVDTYYPEIGRYGASHHQPATAMRTAEQVFVADSRVVISQLRQLAPRSGARSAPFAADDLEADAQAAVNMFATVEGFLGSRRDAAIWWRQRPAPESVVNRAATAQAVELVCQNTSSQVVADLVGADLAAWQDRVAALADYRRDLNGDASSDTTLHPAPDSVLESLLHMHHNRARGIDRANEATSRRIARQIAVAWLERQDGQGG